MHSASCESRQRYKRRKISWLWHMSTSAGFITDEIERLRKHAGFVPIWGRKHLGLRRLRVAQQRAKCYRRAP